MDVALDIAQRLRLPVAAVSHRTNGAVSSLYLWRPDGTRARVSDHRLPRWMDAQIREAHLFLPRRRKLSETRIRRGLILLAAGRPRTARIRAALAGDAA